MKRLLALMLAAALALSLVSCGGGGTGSAVPSDPSNAAPGEEPGNGGENAVPTKEEMLENAEEIVFTDLSDQVSENKVRAADTYSETPLKTYAFIVDIQEEYCDLSNSNNLGATRIRAYLPKEVLAELNTYEGIHIVGTIARIGSEQSESIPGFGAMETDVIEMESVYYIDNILELEGKVQPYKTDEGRVMLGNIFKAENVNVHMSSADASNLDKGDVITVKGVVSLHITAYSDPYEYEMKDTELINVEPLE